MYRVEYLRGEDFAIAAEELGVSVAVVKTVAAVEARQSGFIQGTDLPQILFEGHHFHKRTKGRYAEEYPHLSFPRWRRDHYKGGRGEYDRITQAIRIHNGEPDPALMSTSWGMFQIMGFNHVLAGYDTVQEFVNDMATGEPAQLRAFVRFIQESRLDDELRGQDWEEFARKYNGRGYKKNAYHTKMAVEFGRQVAHAQEAEETGHVPTERGDVVALQTALNVALGGQLSEKLVPDGWIGPKTIRAIRMFQQADPALAVNGQHTDPNLWRALGIDDLITRNPVKEDA